MARSKACVLVLALLAASMTGAGEQPPETEAWALDELDLDLTVDPAARRLSVTGRMVVRLEDPRSDGPALAVNSRATAMRFTRARAEGVDAAVFPYPPAPAIEVAHFTLPRTFDEGDRLTIEFAMESVAESFQLQTDERAFFGSWAEHWYPVPATAAHGTASPAAPGTTTLRMPPGWRSISNGVLERSGTEEGRFVERWRADAPVARSFVAAPFAAVESVESDGRQIRFYLLKPRPSADAQAGALARALGVMEKRFGPYPYPTYAVAEVPEEAEFAASSEQGFLMVRSSVLDRVSASLPLFAHEAAHGWWGNLVRSEGPGGQMFTEALAQFGAVLSIEGLEGKEAMDEFLRFSREGYNPLQCALGYFHIWREGGDKPLARLERDRWDHNLADSKGMWFWHMLRGRMGDEALFAELRSVLAELAGREMTLAQLRARLVAREAALAAFLEQWLDRPGAPVLRVEWWTVDRGQGVEIEVEQMQAGAPFRVPLEVAVVSAAGETTRQTLALAERRQTFTVATPSRALDLKLDPDNRLLMWRPEFGPRPPRAPGPAAAAGGSAAGPSGSR